MQYIPSSFAPYEQNRVVNINCQISIKDTVEHLPMTAECDGCQRWSDYNRDTDAV